MEKIIEISGVPVKFSNNVGWTIEYRDQFGKDVLETMMPVITTTVETAAAIINENGSANNIKLIDITQAIEGRAMDLMLPLSQLGFVDTIVNVAWAMAKAADETIDPPKQWVRQFDNFYVDEIAPEIWKLASVGLASSKNRSRLANLLKGIRANRPQE